MKGRGNGHALALIAFVGLAGGVVGCTDPGETTAIASATGGAFGAGLGAIIGHQTGDAGAGLALGAAAGAGAGAAIGNALEAQEKVMRTQDEAIERQDRIIESQRAELEELRRASQDNVQYGGAEARLRSSLGAQTAGASSRGALSFGSDRAGSERRIPWPPRENVSSEVSGRRELASLSGSLNQQDRFQDRFEGRTAFGSLDSETARPVESLGQIRERSIGTERPISNDVNTPSNFEIARNRYSSSVSSESDLPSPVAPRFQEEPDHKLSDEVRIREPEVAAVGSIGKSPVAERLGDIGLKTKPSGMDSAELNPAPEQDEETVARKVDDPKASIGRVISSTPNTPECEKAQEEAGKAERAGQIADKLFHFRRALRLCPTNPAFHNGLGEVYLSLDRRDDAKFEFSEALRIDPSFTPAQQHLSGME